MEPIHNRPSQTNTDDQLHVGASSCTDFFQHYLASDSGAKGQQPTPANITPTNILGEWFSSSRVDYQNVSHAINDSIERELASRPLIPIGVSQVASACVLTNTPTCILLKATCLNLSQNNASGNDLMGYPSTGSERHREKSSSSCADVADESS